MLTAIVHANSTPGALAATLSSLVPAVAEGLLSHAVVVMTAADADCERIADAMGATVIVAASGPWQAAALTARGPWVILLEAGEIPGFGWIAAVERHLLQQSAERQGVAVLPAAGLLERWRERLSMMTAAGRPRPGLIGPRERVADGTVSGRVARLSVVRERMPGQTG